MEEKVIKNKKEEVHSYCEKQKTTQQQNNKKIVIKTACKKSCTVPYTSTEFIFSAMSCGGCRTVNNGGLDLQKIFIGFFKK